MDDMVKRAQEEKEYILGVGYKYFHILMRMQDLDDENRDIKKSRKLFQEFLQL